METTEKSNIEEKYEIKGYPRDFSETTGTLLENRFCPQSRVLEQEIPYAPNKEIKKRNSVLVKVRRFYQDFALCSVGYISRGEIRWLPVYLNKSSLDTCDLREGDSFQWHIRPNGIVREEDILSHPRRFTIEEVEDSRRTFETLKIEGRE